MTDLCFRKVTCHNVGDGPGYWEMEAELGQFWACGSRIVAKRWREAPGRNKLESPQEGM